MELITDLLDSLGSSNAKVLVILVLNLFGLALKLLERFPNKAIPMTVMLMGAVLFPFVGERPDVRNPLAHLVMNGFLLGAIAWLLHDKVLRRFEKFLPDGVLPGASSQPAASDKNEKPPDTMIRLLLTALLAGSVFLSGSGCSTTQPPGSGQAEASQPDATKIRRVAAIARIAAFDGALLTIDSRPGDRAYFVSAKTALDGLLADKNYDPLAFREAIRKLPIKELRSPVGSILVNTAVEVFDELELETVTIDRSVWLLPVITAVRDGIGKALDQTEPGGTR